ncbi:TPA: single-stranded DNA-binding protein, partial [Acinetobacter baumannii]|nr:single-stranded DNA-binding protein [Acinetobacter baumannii]
NQQQRTFSKYLKNGSKAYIEGSLCTGKWKD